MTEQELIELLEEKVGVLKTHVYILLSTGTHCNGFISRVSKNFHVVCWYILLIQLLP